MIVYVPEELAELEEDLHFFLSLMVRKLHLNRHKGCVIKDKNNEELQHHLHDEMAELRRALKVESQFNVAIECVDVANQAFLLAVRTLHLTRKEFDDDRSKSKAPEKITTPVMCP
jgi:hypothetical protein